MADQAVLDFAGTDAVARGRDHVVVPAGKVELAVLIHVALVAGGHPIADESLAGRLRTPPVFQEHHRVRPRDRDLAQFSRRRLRSVIYEERRHEARVLQRSRPRSSTARSSPL
jgi:hypothetical protein